MAATRDPHANPQSPSSTPSSPGLAPATSIPGEDYGASTRASTGPAIDDWATASTFGSILDPESRAGGLGAELAGELVGFALVVSHPGTWAASDTAYLAGLFVCHEVRGTGIGRALMDALFAGAGERRWSCVYWNTRAGNVGASALYDHCGLGDDFVRYRVPIPSR